MATYIIVSECDARLIRNFLILVKLESLPFLWEHNLTRVPSSWNGTSVKVNSLNGSVALLSLFRRDSSGTDSSPSPFVIVAAWESLKGEMSAKRGRREFGTKTAVSCRSGAVSTPPPNVEQAVSEMAARGAMRKKMLLIVVWLLSLK